MKIGRAAELSRAFTDEDLGQYRLLGGHACSDGTVPEPLIGALFSQLLGVHLPGLGTQYLKQETTFLNPARIDEPLEARVEVTRLRPDKHLVDLATTCTGTAGRVIAEGRALVYVGDVES